MLPIEELLDDDISCDTYSNSTYSSFGVSRHLERRHTAPIEVLIMYVAAHITPPCRVLILYLPNRYAASL